MSTSAYSMNIFKTALRSTLRDLRSGELKLLVFSVCLGVAAMSSVSFLSDRLERGLESHATQLMGGDLVVVSDHEVPLEFKQKAQALGLDMSQTLTLSTMARSNQTSNGSTHLVSLKAVENHYPLKGVVKLQDALAIHAQGASTPAKSQNSPLPSQVWVDPSVLDFLSVSVGQSIVLGDATLRVQAVIEDEPDKGSGFMNFSPRVMINVADLASTHLVLEGSRINWRLALVGTPEHLDQYQAWLKTKLQDQSARGIRLETLKDGRPEMRATLDKASEFLHLVSLLCALLCAVAVALAARGFAMKRLNDCALYRVLGQTQSSIEGVFLLEFGVVGLLASATGLVLGFGMHLGLIELLKGLLDTQLPWPSTTPWWQGLAIGLTLLMTFGWPPIMQLSRVTPMRIIRRDLDPPKGITLGVLILGLGGLGALLVMVSQHLKLGLMVVGGFALAIVLFAVLTWGFIQLLLWVQGRASFPIGLTLATRQLTSRPAYTLLQVSALSVGLLALMLLVLLRTDLIQSWQKSSPKDAPNRFVINLSPSQSEPFQDYLRAHHVGSFDWYPMFRGRLIGINSRAVSAQDYSDDQARRLVDHSFNLSFSAHSPEHNRITRGVWSAQSPKGLSVEAGMAKTLGLSMGDRMVFDVAGESQEGVITSIREVNWTSMRANFFVMFNTDSMPDLPLTYISSFRAPNEPHFDNALIHQFPNITEVDMDATLTQIQSILDQVTLAIEALFLFTLAAGLGVLFAAIGLSRNERLRDQAILRALGATQHLLIRVQRTELIAMGALSGLLASAMAWLIGGALAKYVFDFTWSPNGFLLLQGILAGAALAWVAGSWGLKGVLSNPVMQTLRNSAL